ncbi:MAG: hypothetical protein ACE5LU_20265 [Anaerolineae bacterium]
MNSQPNQPDTHTQLHGRRLTTARAVWIALVVLALATWFASVPPSFDELRVPCTGEECDLLAITPQEANMLGEVGLSMEFYAGYQVGIQIFNVAIYTLLAGVIFWRRSDDRLGLFVSLTLVVIATHFFSSVPFALVKAYPSLTLLLGLLGSLAMASFVLLLFLFPDGRFVPRWTRLLAIILGVYLVIASFLTGGDPDLMYYTPGLLSLALKLLLFGSLGVGVFAQVYRYRRVSGSVQRQQTKWVVFGLCALVLMILIFAIAVEFFPPPPGPARLYVNFGGMGVVYLLGSLFPLSLTIAILRYRLWDIDVLINRTMVYGALTGALALVYFGTVVVLQGLFRALTGQESQLAVVASTLAIAGLFLPLRRRIQEAIDRRFYRRKYDAEKVLAEFAEFARDEVDLDKLTDELLRVIDETMQPEFVSLWLRDIPSGSAERREEDIGY